MKKFLILFVLSSCSQLIFVVDDSRRNDIRIQKQSKYFEVKGAENIFRKRTAVTLQIEFMQTGKQEGIQDLMAFSVGGNTQKSLTSRASIRLEPGGRLVGIARSTDSEEGQVLRSKNILPPGKKHVATLVIDYAQDEMKLYLDGEQVETEGKIRFASKETPDTPSLSAALGSEDDGSTFYFEGTLSNPKMWTRKLSSEEIQANYHRK